MAYCIPYCIGIVFVVCIICIDSGFGLSCYECNSHNDTRCSMEELPDEFNKPCPLQNKDGKKFILCRKIKQIIDFEVNGLPADKRIIRTCGWDDSTYKDNCYQRSGFGGRQEVCACETDGCNGAGSLYASGAILTVGAILAKITHSILAQ